MKKAATPDLVFLISDTHCGSLFAPCPHVNYMEGFGVWPTKVQQWLMFLWKEATEKWMPLIAQGRPYDLIHVGDCIDGVHFRDAEIVTRSVNRQREMCVELIGKIAHQARHFYLVRGTAAHVGLDDENEIGRVLGAQRCPRTGDYAAQEWRLKYNGIGLNAKHHRPTTGRWWLQGNAVAREVQNSIAFRHEARWPEEEIERIFIRGHAHTFDISTTRDGMGIGVPSWKLHDSYANKVVPSVVGHVGMVALDFAGLDEGEMPRVRKYIKYVMPTPLGATWKESDDCQVYPSPLHTEASSTPTSSVNSTSSPSTPSKPSRPSSRGKKSKSA